LALSLSLQGLGIGLSMTPLSALGLSRVTPAQAGLAAGIIATAQWVGNSLGVALIGLLFFARVDAATPASYQTAFDSGLLYLLATILVFILVAHRAIDSQAHEDETPSAPRRKCTKS
jgi:MFS family permease